MAIKYIASGAISIFPLNKSRDNYPQDNLLYEANIANLINQLLDVDGFIISGPDKFTDIDPSNPLIVNIKGYNIKITAAPTTITEASPSNIYLCLQLTTNSNTSLTEIDGQDDNEEYKGVYFSDKKPEKENTYSLHVYSRTGNGYTKVNKSENKFNLSSLNIIGIDGQYKN